MSGANKSESLRRVVAILDKAYGRPVLTPRHAPLDELIFTVLSQHTADVNTERTFTALRTRFQNWSQVRDAEVGQVEKAIALGGLAHTKAPRIQHILAALTDGDGAPNLDELAALDDESARDFLMSLPGVGPKTAACVLLFSLGRPVMPVDTHVHRVARRLGLLSASTSAARSHPLLTAMIGDDAEQMYAAHVGLVSHGRRVCHARRPCCGVCSLAPLCPSAPLA